MFLFRLQQLVHQVCNLSARLYEGSFEGLNLVLEVGEVALLEAGRLVVGDEKLHLVVELSFLLKGPSLAFFRLQQLVAQRLYLLPHCFHRQLLVRVLLPQLSHLSLIALHNCNSFFLKLLEITSLDST